MREAIKKVLAIAAERRDHPGLLEFVNLMVGYDLLTSPELNVLYGRMVPLDHAIILCHLQIAFAERLLQFVRKQYPWGKTLDGGDVVALMEGIKPDFDGLVDELVMSLSAEDCAMMAIFKSLHVHAACAFDCPEDGHGSPGVFDDGTRVQCVQYGGMVRIDYREAHLPVAYAEERVINYQSVKDSIAELIGQYRNWYGTQVQAYFDAGHSKMREMKGDLAASIKQHKARLAKLQDEQAVYLGMLGILEEPYFKREKKRLARLGRFIRWMSIVSRDNVVVRRCYAMLGEAAEAPPIDGVNDSDRLRECIMEILPFYRIDPNEMYDVKNPVPISLDDKIKAMLMIDNRYRQLKEPISANAQERPEVSLSLERRSTDPLNAFAAFAIVLDVSELSLRHYIASYLAHKKWVYAHQYPGGVFKFDSYVESIRKGDDVWCPMELTVMREALGHLIVWVDAEGCLTMHDEGDHSRRPPVFVEQHEGQLFYPLYLRDSLDAQVLHDRLESPKCRAVILPYQGNETLEGPVARCEETPDPVRFRILASNGGIYPISAVATSLGWDEMVLIHAWIQHLRANFMLTEQDALLIDALNERYETLQDKQQEHLYKEKLEIEARARREAAEQGETVMSDLDASRVKRRTHQRHTAARASSKSRLAVDPRLVRHEVARLQALFRKPVVLLEISVLSAPRLSDFPHDPFFLFYDRKRFGAMVLVDEPQVLEASLKSVAPKGRTDGAVEAMSRSSRSAMSPEASVKDGPRWGDSSAHSLLHLAMLYANAPLLACVIGPGEHDCAPGYLKVLPSRGQSAWLLAFETDIGTVRQVLENRVKGFADAIAPLIQNRVTVCWDVASANVKSDAALAYLHEIYGPEGALPRQSQIRLHPLVWKAYATLLGVALYLWTSSDSDNKLIAYAPADVGWRVFASQPVGDGQKRIDVLINEVDGEAAALIEYWGFPTQYPKAGAEVYPYTYGVQWEECKLPYQQPKLKNHARHSLMRLVATDCDLRKKWIETKKNFDEVCSVNGANGCHADAIEEAVIAAYNHAYMSVIKSRNSDVQLCYQMVGEDRNTMAHYLMQMNQSSLLATLVVCGASLTVPNSYGVRPWMMYDNDGRAPLHRFAFDQRFKLLESILRSSQINLAMPERLPSGKSGPSFVERLLEGMLGSEALGRGGVLVNRDSMEYRLICMIRDRYEDHRNKHNEYKDELAEYKSRREQLAKDLDAHAIELKEVEFRLKHQPAELDREKSKLALARAALGEEEEALGLLQSKLLSYPRSVRRHSSPIGPGEQRELRIWSPYELDVDAIAVSSQPLPDPGMWGRYRMFGVFFEGEFKRRAQVAEDAHELNRSLVLVSFLKQDDRMLLDGERDLGLFDTNSREQLALCHEKAVTQEGYGHKNVQRSEFRQHMNIETMRRSLAQKNGKLEESKRLLETAEKEKIGAEKELVKAQSQLDAVCAKVSAAEKDVTVAEQALRAANAELRCEKSDQERANLSGVSDPSFNMKIESAQLAVQAAEKQLQGVKAAVKKAKADMAPAQAKVRAQEVEVRRAEEGVVSAQARVAEKEGEVQTFKEQVDRLEEAIAGGGAAGSVLPRSNGGGPGSPARLALPGPSVQ